MPSKYLDDDDRVVRYVSWAKLRRDEDDNVLGCLPSAFLLRNGETYLSVSWCEYFDGSADECLRCCIEAIRSSKIEVRPKGRFAVAVVGRLKVGAAEGGRKLRIIHEATEDNPAHAAIRGWASEDEELLDLLAEEVWTEALSAADANDLPASSCQVSARGAA